MELRICYNKTAVPSCLNLVERLILPNSLKQKLQQGGLDVIEGKVIYKMKWRGNEYDGKIELTAPPIEGTKGFFWVKDDYELIQGGSGS